MLEKGFWPGLHNSESSKGQIDQHKLAAGRKSLFRHSVEEILKGQVIIQSRAFVTFSATEFSRAACGLRAVCCAGLLLTQITSLVSYKNLSQKIHSCSWHTLPRAR